MLSEIVLIKLWLYKGALQINWSPFNNSQVTSCKLIDEINFALLFIAHIKPIERTFERVFN